MMIPSHGLYIVMARNDDHRLCEHHKGNLDDFSIGKNTYLLLVDESNHEKLLEENELLFAEEYSPDDKTVLDYGGVGRNHVARLQVVWYDDVNDEVALEIGLIEGVEVISYYHHFLVVSITSNHQHALKTLKYMKSVVRILPKLEFSLMNYYANEILQGKYPGTSDTDFKLHHHGLTGSGQLIGISDSGLDWKSCFFHDPEYGTNIVFGEKMESHRKIEMYQIMDGTTKGEAGSGSHGTHVSGSAAGKCYSQSPNYDTVGKFSGSAKDSKIYFQDMGGSDGGFVDMDNLYYNLFLPAYEGGVRVHTNSWGNGIPSIYGCVFDCNCTFKFPNGSVSVEYNGLKYHHKDLVPKGYCKDIEGVPSDRCCEVGNAYRPSNYDVDSFLYDNDEMLILYAVGNEGDIAEFRMIASPATSPNCLSVGNAMTSNEGIINAYKWFNPNAFRYIFGLMKSDCSITINDMSECCASTGCYYKKYCCPYYNTPEVDEMKSSSFKFNQSNLAQSSSKGPTFDGRIKPDVVAPGKFLTSANSMNLTTSKVHCGLYNENLDERAMVSMMGTSMSTPMLAGIAVLTRQYFVDGFYPSGKKNEKDSMSAVSGNLIKTVIVHSGKKMDGMLENGGGVWRRLLTDDVNSKLIPDSLQGFGLPKLAETLKLSDSDEKYRFNILDRVSIDREEEHIYRFKYSGPIELFEFSATMGWYEKPNKITGFVTTGVVRNDLDLSGTFHLPSGEDVNIRGNVMYSNIGDSKNNLEKITFPKDKLVGTGTEYFTFEVRVYGYSVFDRIKYALVVSGFGFECLQQNADISSMCSTCKSGWTNSWECDTENDGSTSKSNRDTSVIVASVLGGSGVLIVFGICVILLCSFCFLLLLFLCVICVCLNICISGSGVGINYFLNGRKGRIKNMKGLNEPMLGRELEDNEAKYKKLNEDRSETQTTNERDQNAAVGGSVKYERIFDERMKPKRVAPTINLDNGHDDLEPESRSIKKRAKSVQNSNRVKGLKKPKRSAPRPPAEKPSIDKWDSRTIESPRRVAPPPPISDRNVGVAISPVRLAGMEHKKIQDNLDDDELSVISGGNAPPTYSHIQKNTNQ